MLGPSYLAPVGPGRLQEHAVSLWRRGMDTVAISRALGIPEADAERILHVWCEQRRRK